MPVSPISKVYAVEDAKIAKLTADTSGDAEPTYAPAVDVPGIKSVGLSFDFQSVELRGDNKRLDSDSSLVGVTLSFEHAKLSTDVLGILIGGTSATGGTAPAETLTYTRTGTDSLEYFKFEAKTPTSGVDTSGGDLHLIAHKLKVTSYELGLAEEDYQTFSGEAQGVFTISSDSLFDLVFNAQSTPIATA
jgi:hypothetical protein